MGLSIAQPPSGQTVLAELSLAEGQAQEAEGLTLPQELMHPEKPAPTPLPGTLRSGGKEYCFIQQAAGTLSQKLGEQINDLNRPQLQKLADPKSGLHHLTFKEEAVKEKTFKTWEPLKQHLEAKQTSSEKTVEKTRSLETPSKAQSVGKKALEKAEHPPTAAQLKESGAIRQHQNNAKQLERRLQKEIEKETRKDVKHEKKENERLREKDPQARIEKNEKRQDPLQEQQKSQREEEEGFADGRQHSQQDSDSDQEEFSKATHRVEATFNRELAAYAAEQSILSSIFNMRVSQFDVLILFLEIMKLDLKGREQQKIARQQERELQLIHMQNMVDNFKSQANWQLFASLGAGILGIVSGAAPIIGHMKGDWILEKLGGFFESLRDAKKDQFFKNISKITYAMSQMQEATGKIQETFSQGHRTYDQHMSDIHKTDWDESTRTMEELKDDWKSIENFLYQSLQMYHDAIRSLYN